MGNIEGGITMLINMNNDKNIPTDTEACYEELASQEELYLEETEEEVRAILTSYVSPASQSDRSTIIDICAERESDLEIGGAVNRPNEPPHGRKPR